MRFARLSLERYGRFENCSLDFRSGAPDLHVVFGANEAGKSTTLAAVSDLLFGFPARSPFNFRFDYPLLRIGAVLEAEGTRFACRRRKAAEALSLVDADDRPIDAAPLRAMLQGYDEKRFRLGFSLDQTRLREGGRAMVEAKDDLGQALFAAGSGMTGVASTLAALKTEADAVWGPRAAARRLYTMAERQHEEAQRRLRELQLKPRAWTDARDALELLSQALADREAERAALTGERRRLERLRRIGPHLHRRAELMDALATGPSLVRLSAQAETTTEAALVELAAATRAQAAATALLDELDARADAHIPDTAALDAAEAVQALVERRGAEQKGLIDLARLRADLAARRDREARLRTEIGGDAPAVPRLTIARLRELAGRLAQADAALATLRASSAEAEQRIAPLRLALAAAPVAEGLGELSAAVDAALALGADADARCTAQAVMLDRLDADARSALQRLAPWIGSAATLAALPMVGAEEIDAAHTARARARDAAQAEQAAMARADAAAEALALKRRALAQDGQAVPAERIEAARTARDAAWAGLRDHLLGDAPLADPAAQTLRFEASVGEADAAADQRFARAEASGRLAVLDLQAAELALARTQAQTRRDTALSEEQAATQAWTERLAACGLPGLEPLRLRAWLEMRREALDADRAARTAREVLNAELARRAQARARLAALLPAPERGLGPGPGGQPGPASPDATALAPVLEAAGRLRAEGEARDRRFADDRAALRGLEEQLASLSRQTARLQPDRSAGLADWERERALCGLDLPAEAAEGWLQILDELRIVGEEAEGLGARIAGIERDARAFAADVAALCDRLADGPGENPGEDPRRRSEPDPGRRLDHLRARLAAARSTADVQAEIETTRRVRREALRAAQAARDAALSSLAPRCVELGVAEVAAIAPALEASRQARRTREALAQAEQQITADGDGYPLDALAAAFAAEEPDALATRLERLDLEIAGQDARITAAADAVGSARRTFEALEATHGAPEAAADAALARAEMDAQAETYLLKRAQALTLRWAVDRFRERRQNPLLARASELFSTLTLGRYRDLRPDPDADHPRLLGLCEDGTSLVEVGQMSEGATDQLFLALRLAAVEQAIASGVRLPFLADDLFVNFDDDRALAGLKVLADLARSTQVLVFTHHAHLSDIARQAVGAEVLSECRLTA